MVRLCTLSAYYSGNLTAFSPWFISCTSHTLLFQGPALVALHTFILPLLNTSDNLAIKVDQLLSLSVGESIIVKMKNENVD